VFRWGRVDEEFKQVQTPRQGGSSQGAGGGYGAIAGRERITFDYQSPARKERERSTVEPVFT